MTYSIDVILSSIEVSQSTKLASIYAISSKYLTTKANKSPYCIKKRFLLFVFMYSGGFNYNIYLCAFSSVLRMFEFLCEGALKNRQHILLYQYVLLFCIYLYTFDRKWSRTSKAINLFGFGLKFIALLS